MIIRITMISIFCAIVLFSNGQISYEILAPCPEKISNTAITGVIISDRPYVYIFSGIDTTKSFEGIHARSYKFDLLDNEWSVLPSLPDGQDRIAAGASTIKDKIYILGGYEVFEDGDEVSLNQLHVFDPITDSFLDNAAPIPTPIDDHVQLVYQDSLLYSITGWSNTGNVNEVWLYNPSNDTWSECTALPLGPIFSSFGSSGSIVGDTIYFFGGASEIGPFNLSDRFRKGFIHPDDPTQIDWIMQKTDNAIGYRMGAAQIDSQAFWLGGSQTSYNYDGIAYNGSGGVAATSRLVQYDPTSGVFLEYDGLFPDVMDLRGLAQVGPKSFVSVGGMVDNQEVTDRVVKYDLDIAAYSVDYQVDIDFEVKPNPTSGTLVIDTDFDLDWKAIEVFSSQGIQIVNSQFPEFPFSLDCSLWNDGLYFVRLVGKDGRKVSKSVTVAH